MDFDIFYFDLCFIFILQNSRSSIVSAYANITMHSLWNLYKHGIKVLHAYHAITTGLWCAIALSLLFFVNNQFVYLLSFTLFGSSYTYVYIYYYVFLCSSELLVHSFSYLNLGKYFRANTETAQWHCVRVLYKCVCIQSWEKFLCFFSFFFFGSFSFFRSAFLVLVYVCG